MIDGLRRQTETDRRRNRAYGCIYTATNRITGRVYIGKSIYGLAARRWSHRTDAKAGKGFWFAASIRSHGLDAFDWAEVYLSNDDDALLEAERLIIGYAKAAGTPLYNLTEGGQGSIGAVRTPEMREHLSRVRKGRKFTDEHRQAISQSRPKKLPPWTDERRAKHAATIAMRGPPVVSEETRRRQSEAAKRRAQREAEKRRLKEIGLKGRAVRWGAPS